MICVEHVGKSMKRNQGEVLRQQFEIICLPTRSKFPKLDADPVSPGLLHRNAPTLLVSWEVSDGVVRPRANPSCSVKVWGARHPWAKRFVCDVEKGGKELVVLLVFCMVNDDKYFDFCLRKIVIGTIHRSCTSGHDWEKWRKINAVSEHIPKTSRIVYA